MEQQRGARESAELQATDLGGTLGFCGRALFRNARGGGALGGDRRSAVHTARGAHPVQVARGHVAQRRAPTERTVVTVEEGKVPLERLRARMRDAERLEHGQQVVLRDLAVGLDHRVEE